MRKISAVFFCPDRICLQRRYYEGGSWFFAVVVLITGTAKQLTADVVVAHHKVSAGVGGRMWQVDFNGAYHCSQSGTDCDMVIHTQQPDGSYISEVVYPCGVIVHSQVGTVHWYQVGSSTQGSGSFAGMTFLPNEYRLEIDNYPNDTDYNGVSVPLDGVTADSQGWIHVFVPHP